jgi:Predicted membrane protein
MSSTERTGLWSTLRERGIVNGEPPPPGEARTPWFVRALAAIGGWIGALFLLGFVGTAFSFLFKNGTGAFVVGALVCAGAIAILRAAPRNDFVRQFGFAVSLAGQALLCFGTSELFGNSTRALGLYLALQQLLLFVLVPDFTHRVWTSWSAGVAASVAMLGPITSAFIPALLTGVFAAVALHELDSVRALRRIRPALYGLALATILSAVFHHETAELFSRPDDAASAPSSWTLWLKSLALTAVLLWTANVLLRHNRIPPRSRTGLLAISGAIALGLLSLQAPGVAPAVAILILGFAHANRVLAGLGLLSLIGYLIYFYYSLHATLLEKSALLAVSGITLLAARFLFRAPAPASTTLSQGDTPHA